jgi:hypothetical protein
MTRGVCPWSAVRRFEADARSIAVWSDVDVRNETPKGEATTGIEPV